MFRGKRECCKFFHDIFTHKLVSSRDITGRFFTSSRSMREGEREKNPSHAFSFFLPFLFLLLQLLFLRLSRCTDTPVLLCHLLSFPFSFFSPVLLRLFVSSFSIDYIYRLREYRGELLLEPLSAGNRNPPSFTYYYYFVRAWILRASSSTFSLLAGTSRSSVVGTERGIHVRYTLLSYRIQTPKFQIYI